MYKREAMKEKLIKTESGENVTIKYATVKSKTENGLVYGIEISLVSETGELKDFIKIEDITANSLEMNCIFMLLYNYTVTPTTLYDVLDVYFADADSFMEKVKI